MNLVTMGFGLLAAATAAYMFVCLLAVMLSWFPARAAGSFGDFARRAAAPFFALFRSRKPRQGSMDLSPVAGFVVLSVLFSLFSAMSSYGTVSLYLFLLTLLSAASFAVASLIVLFGVVALVRLGFLLARPRLAHPALSLAGRIVEPLVNAFTRLLFRDRIVPYKTALAVTVAFLAAGRVLLALLVDFLGGLILKIPF